MSKTLRTKDIVTSCNIGREALRFYERKGLIPNPIRTQSGYRVYPKETLRRIAFIKVARSIGFTLSEIKVFLAVNNKGPVTRKFVIQSIEDKLVQINEKLASLHAVKTTLEELKNQTLQTCRSEVICPILGKIRFHSK